jgi:hypothetical protein
MDLVEAMDFTEAMGFTDMGFTDVDFTDMGFTGGPGGGVLQHGHITEAPGVTPTMVIRTIRVTPTMVIRTIRFTGVW